MLTFALRPTSKKLEVLLSVPRLLWILALLVCSSLTAHAQTMKSGVLSDPVHLQFDASEAEAVELSGTVAEARICS